MKLLTPVQFGDPILRQPARRITKKEITSNGIKSLIQNMRHTLEKEKLGVGLAAPQVGEGIAMAVIKIQPTAHRPQVEPFDLVLINPVITQTTGRKKQLWEGCISSGKGRTGLFAKVPRYAKLQVTFHDEHGALQRKEFNGLKAHIIQHEVDHLNGVLFVDKVKDTTTYMTYDEYLKRVKKRPKKTA